MHVGLHVGVMVLVGFGAYSSNSFLLRVLVFSVLPRRKIIFKTIGLVLVTFFRIKKWSYNIADGIRYNLYVVY